MNVTAGHVQPSDRPVAARGDPMNPLEALVQARLDDIHADVGAARARRAVVRRGASDGGDLRRAVRVRIGRGLVALGAAVAGDERHAHERRTA
jgi:hypothetical protein